LNRLLELKRILTLGPLLPALGLLVLCVAYVLPRHPSVDNRAVLNAAVHIAIFAAVGLWFGLAGVRKRVFVLLGVLAALLEVLQWWIGGYPRIEFADIVANEVGLLLAGISACFLARRRKTD
jgi:MFS superfamily sulfate permease-like transporter